ncbi:replication protein A 32 kDa subunit A-like [Henckelia pumila]|uniref:replication protein A 32 kDa subunit A-like n=1 Tax=Henckelia pumila TaxID=405737 RepID=UPI003C6DF478
MMFESSQNDASAINGGFISSQTSDPSPTSAKSRDNQPMYPATVKQLIEATPSADDKSGYLIDGVDVYNVKLVGMTYDKSERVTDVSFAIDDGTGRIGCHRWINDSQDTKEVEGLTDGTYVRVHGHLKSVKGRRQVVVYAIRPVTNYNEVATHFLECIHAHCSSPRIKNGVSVPSSSSLVIGTPKPNNPSSSTQVSHEYNLDGLGSIDKMVLDYLQQPLSLAQEKGIHRNEIAQKLKVSPEKIIEIMESLESEGLVYSTIDEFHYKSTAG